MKLIAAVMVALLSCTPLYAHDFKMLTWNVYMLPWPIKQSRQAERTKIIAEQLKKTDYDIIVLQEAFMSSFKNRVKNSMRATHPYTYRLGKLWGITKRFDSGVFVLSKYPIRLKDKVYYTNCEGFDCYASKGAALLEVTIDGQDMQFVSTHMQSGQSEVHSRVRAKQLAQINKMLMRNSKSNIWQFLAGDLNIDALKVTEFEAALQSLGMHAPKLQGTLTSSKAPLTSCFGKANTTRQARVDHVLVKYDQKPLYPMYQKIIPIRAKVNGQMCDLSDHLPVEMEMKI